MGCAKRLRGATVGAFLMSFLMLGAAQEYPVKPVKTVIAFTPASATDVLGRVVTQRLSELWIQPVVPENRPGAGGSIASAGVARSDPDGYTLLLNSNAHAVNPAIYTKLSYDTLRDFANVVPVVSAAQVLVVSPDSPLKGVADLVAHAKSHPSALNFAHAGQGSGTHMNLEVFAAAAGIKVTQIAYRGTPEAFTAVMSRSVDAFWMPLPGSVSILSSGKLKALAVSTPARSPLLPDVPTTGEAGVANANFPGWLGIWAPAGTPTIVVNRVNADVRRILAEPEVREKLVGLGGVPMDMTPEQFAKFVRSEIEFAREIVRRAAIKPQ